MRATHLFALGAIACSSTAPELYVPHHYAAGTQANAPWPMLSHDAGGTGRAGVRGARSSAIKWTIPTGAFIGMASPVVAADGTIYIGNSAGALTAVHPDGSRAWQTATMGGIEGAPAIAADGSIYVASDDARLHVVSVDGSDTSGAAASDSLVSSVLIGDDGTAYFVAHHMGCWSRRGGAISCDLDASKFAIAAGRLWLAGVWLLETYGTSPLELDAGLAVAQGRFGAVLDDGTSFVLSNGRLEAHDANGVYLWSCNLPATMYELHVAISDPGRVYVRLPTGVMLASAAGPVWSVDVGATVAGELAVDAEGAVYFGANDGKLYGYDGAGARIFAIATGGPIRSSPAIGADGTVYIGSDDGLLYAVGP